MYDFEFDGVMYELLAWDLNPAEPDNGIMTRWVDVKGWKRVDGKCPDFDDQETEERFLIEAAAYILDTLDDDELVHAARMR